MRQIRPALVPMTGDCFFRCARRELRDGGRLVVVLPGLSDAATTGFEPLFHSASAALEGLVSDGVISDDERKRMVVGVYPRRRAQLLEPFNANGHFQSLSVEHCEIFDLPDAALGFDFQSKPKCGSFCYSRLHCIFPSDLRPLPCCCHQRYPQTPLLLLTAWNKN